VSSDVPNVFAKRITPARRWNDLSLPDDLTAQLRRIPTEFAQNRAGVTALFTGPSGTGKTLASEAIAGELNLELFRINLSSVISKHIGETEKNLTTVFSEAGRSDVILFFDEADALFADRSDVKDARDRYQNLEINYLLKRIEEHSGIAILATNVRHTNEAFVRRMKYVIDFPHE
jgi:SpoVK/Ycf46/Vps4 family AAA+-type ATPase